MILFRKNTIAFGRKVEVAIFNRYEILHIGFQLLISKVHLNGLVLKHFKGFLVFCPQNWAFNRQYASLGVERSIFVHLTIKTVSKRTAL